jgi:hypothetical protein
MQSDIPAMNDTPHWLNDVPHENGDFLRNEGRSPFSGGQAEQPPDIEQPSPQEAAERLERAAADQGEDSVLMIETIVLPDAAEEAFPGEASEGTDLDIALPWYRSRWFYISAGVVTTAVSCAGTLLLIQEMNKRRRRRALMGKVKTGWQQASLFPMRGASLRAPGRFDQLITQLSGLAQQAPSRIKAMQRQLRSNSVSKRTRGQLEKSSQLAARQISLLGEKARATSVRTANQVQNSLSSVGTGISNGVAYTGKSVHHTWNLGRIFAIGLGSGAVWASLFTPRSGEENRAHLAEILQRFGKKETRAKGQ